MKKAKRNIKAILFDSGRVLNISKSGHWFISPKFFEYIDKNTFNNIADKKRKLAFKKAGEYINAQSLIKTKEEEYSHFVNYYEIFSKELPELKISDSNIKALAKDLVYNPYKYEFYDDVMKVIPKLKEKYKLAIVSDAWPSLEDVYKERCLYNYFNSFVISSVLGVTKPNERMYLEALEEIKVLPSNAVFVDDNLKNCKGAMKLGIQAVLLCRDKKQYTINKILSIGKPYRVIRNLEEFEDVIA